MHSRRHFLRTGFLGLGAAGLSPLAHAASGASQAAKIAPNTEPFFGQYQGGIATPAQKHTYFVAFDVLTDQRDELIAMLQAWTQIAAELTQHSESAPKRGAPDAPPVETGAMIGLPPSRLTLTFGIGPSLFTQEGKDRFGLAHRKPEALVDLPRFVGDQLVPERVGGDLSVQACADDFFVVETAVRRMASAAKGKAVMRWAQSGFNGGFSAHETPRNQMGFKDGTRNVNTQDPQEMNRFVWVGSEGPNWLQNGSYMVIRPIRIALDHWDEMKLSFQEETVGRKKYSGAPIGSATEKQTPAFEREDKDGNPVINEMSHMAMSAPEHNDGAKILRRAFSYDNGIAKIAERWPPWKQSVTFDAGLLFQCYQKDPRTGFIKVFAHTAQMDMLNQFTTHVGGGLFACPGGVRKGEFVAQKLFE